MKNKLTPTGYALLAFLAVPALAVVAILALVGLVLILVGYWPVLPFAVYATMKKSRTIYGTLPVATPAAS